MFGIGMPELLLIFVLALLLFGPKELPRIARSLGRAMADLRRASDELTDSIRTEVEALEREAAAPPAASPEPGPRAGERTDPVVAGAAGTEAATGSPQVTGSAGASAPGKEGSSPA